MFIKATILGCALVSTPLAVVTLQQDPIQDDPAAPKTRHETQDNRKSDEVEALREKIRELEAAAEKLESSTREARRRATKAQAEIATLKAKLDGALDLLVKSTKRDRHRNCTPSRTRKLLTYYQWMETNGHAEQADKMMTQVIKDTGNRNSSLNSLAWNLMTEKTNASKYDKAALALAVRMSKNGHLRHNEYDTVALASFLNGKVAEAIEFQKHAIEKGGSNHEYRRRLRVYEAAARTDAATEIPSGIAGGQ